VVDPNLPTKSLSIKGLRAGYGSLDILNGVDLDVPQGQFVALMGPNGAGKSTLLKSLYGMTTIRAAGPLQFSGHDDRRKPANGRLHASRRQGEGRPGLRL
jgi:ABC-type branched-subunit amino acid transport system ATPase component